MSAKRVLLASILGIGLASAAAGSVAAEPVYMRSTTDAVLLPETAGDAGRTRVLAVRVPAGSWMIVAKATAVARFPGNTFDIVRCLIRSDDLHLDSAATNVGGADNFPAVATIALSGAVTTTSKTTMELSCQHDNPIADEYIDPDAKLLVLKVDTPLR